MSITAPGLPALLADLGDMATAAADTRQPDQEAAIELAAAARVRARKVTGYMADSITPRVGHVDVLAEYAHIVHDGHRGIVPNPFIPQAVDAVDPEPPYAAHLDRVVEQNIRTRY